MLKNNKGYHQENNNHLGRNPFNVLLVHSSSKCTSVTGTVLHMMSALAHTEQGPIALSIHLTTVLNDSTFKYSSSM